MDDYEEESREELRGVLIEILIIGLVALALALMMCVIGVFT